MRAVTVTEDTDQYIRDNFQPCQWLLARTVWLALTPEGARRLIRGMFHIHAAREVPAEITDAFIRSAEKWISEYSGPRSV